MAQRLSGMESLWPGRVTQVIDPHYFWMQLGTRDSLSQFEKIQRNLQEYGRHSFRSLGEADQLEYGQVVLVDTGDSSAFRFKRGQVARITSGNSVDIFYVDYGNTELTTLDKIMTNLPAMFKSWMPQAVRCSLAGVRPISKNWTTRGTKTFQSATSGILLHTLVLHGEPGYCEVSLYPSDADDARAVCYSLLDEEVAMQKDGEEVPEFVKDIPEYMNSYMSRAFSEKMRPVEDYQMFQKQDPITVETSNSLHIAPSSASPASSTPSNGRSSDKYIPPGRKYHEKTQRSPGSQYEGSPPNHNSTSAGSMSSPPVKTTTLQISKAKEPVVDFFPFDNVSTYPPTPVSPVKSPGRSSNTAGSQESSYFTRTPSRYDQADQQSNRDFQDNGQHYRGRGRDYNENADRNVYRNGTERSHRKSHEHHHERSRFAANFDNLPSAHSAEDAIITNSSAAANLEPPYLSQRSDIQHTSGDISQSSVSPGKPKQVSPQDYSPSRPVRNINNSVPPFYPPSPVTSMPNHGNSQSVNLNTPQYYLSKGSNSDGYEELTPPGYYQSHKNGVPSNHSDPYYASSGDTYGYHGDPQYKSDTMNNPSYGYRSGEHYSAQDYSYTYGTIDNGPNQQRYDPRYYSQDGRSSGYYNNHDNNDYHDPKATSGSSFKQSMDMNSHTRERPPRPHVKISSNQTPSKSGVPGQSKMSPASPESPGIAAFDLSDIENTQFASADMFHQRIYQERLQTLQEEAVDIATESKEQSELAQMARYGIASIGEGESHNFYHPVDHEAFHQISEDISVASRENDEMKKSPIKRSEPLIHDRPPKVEGMPVAYVPDIDFTEAVKEVLDFAKTGGIENAKALLDNIVESLRTTGVEKQLFDVLLMLLAKAVQEYDLCQVVMDTIHRLNSEMELKEALAKALKRQQEMCVKLPVKKNPQHQNFSRVMAAVYNMARDWSNNNATIQDIILVTVEKWILFNNKGTQIGQTDKENVFLDCFVAFWEVSGSQLLKHNDSFRSRLQDEIKQKLLNESVSRPIRERLLDILFEFFMGSNTVSVVMENSCTQTPRKTMIPSSCQVKPFVCDKGTLTDADWLEDYSGYEPDDTRWYSATDFNSPETSVNLRPLGQRSKVNHLTSTPEEQTSRKKTQSSVGSPQNGANSGDQSYCSSTTETEYSTPNSSFISDRSRLKSAQNLSNNAANPAVCQGVPEQTNSVKGESLHNAREAQKSVRSKGSASEGKTVCETKSAVGKSIVDWFDYQPEVEATSKSTKDKSQNVRAKSSALETAVSRETKSDLNLKDVTKDFDNLSLSSIEDKYSVIQKGKISVEQVSASAKSRKKDKKAAKNVTATSKGDKCVSNSSGIVDKGKSVEVKIKKGGDRSEKGPRQGVGDRVTDWWGADDVSESKSTQSKHGACHIHMDANPDVIIEDEFIEDIKTTVSVEHQKADTDNSNNSPGSDTRDCSSSPKSQSSFIQMDEVNHDKSSAVHGETGLGVDEDVKGLTSSVNDMYGFEGELSGDNWESDDSEELNVGLSVVDNEEERTNIINDSSKTTEISIGAAFDNEDEEYNRKFPRTNLAEYIRPTLMEPVQSAPVSRWVPKKRICLNCHEEDHTTENCPKGILLLQ